MKDIYERISELCKTQASFALLFCLILFFLSLSVVLPLFLSLTVFLWGGALEDLSSLLSGNLESFDYGAYLFRLVQSENQLLTWGFTAVAMAYFLGRPTQVLKVEKSIDLRDIGIAALILLLIIPIIQAIYIPADSFELPTFLKGFEADMKLREAESQKVLLELFSDPSMTLLFLNLLVFAAIPAFCEEFFFRGILQQQFSRSMSPHLAIALSAAIFSFIHFQFYGFFGRMLLGIILGYFLYASGSLWPSIFAHFVFNAFSIILTYLAAAKGILETEIANNEYEFPLSMILFSFLSVGMLMFLYLRRERIPNKTT